MIVNVMDILEARLTGQTFSDKQGYKRKPQKVQPSVDYDTNRHSLTDKQVELYLLQHRNMVEFLEQNGLTDTFNEFQKKKVTIAGDPLAAWFKKWH